MQRDEVIARAIWHAWSKRRMPLSQIVRDTKEDGIGLGAVLGYAAMGQRIEAMDVSREHMRQFCGRQIFEDR